MEWSHIDARGNACMVDISAKAESVRHAEAFAEVLLGEEAFCAVEQQQIAKGDVLAVARIAGIQAAKKTSELIPLCHSIPLAHIAIHFSLKVENHSVAILSQVKTTASTGVEMEALTAAGVAALAIYDMCKALNKAIRITDIHLVSKTGGKSGNFQG